MNPATETASFRSTHHVGKAAALALRLADAENALHALTSGQVDAIVDPTGRTYLLRPAQAHLRQNERRLRAVLDSVADVIAVVSRAGVILIGNHAMRRVLGYEPEKLVGRVMFKLVHVANVSAVYSAFIAVAEGFEERATVCFRHLARDGSYRWVEATIGKFQDDLADGVVLTMRPTADHPGVTEDESIALHPAITLDTRGRAGDVRTFESDPTLAMMSRDTGLQALLLENWEDSTTAGRYTARLQLASINARGDVRLVLDLEQSKVSGTRIEVLIDLEGFDHGAIADPLRLQQAMWSLVRNTVESFDQNRIVSAVGANDAEGDLAYAHIVPGAHVEPELLPLVFGSLQEGVDAMQQLYESLRFGLFVAKTVAEAQGGTLTISNDPCGQNAPFRLNFKVTPATTTS